MDNGNCFTNICFPGNLKTFIEFFCNADLVWINYSDVRILNGDLIMFWGEVAGQKSYVNGAGGSMTVPEVDASAISITPKK